MGAANDIHNITSNLFFRHRGCVPGRLPGLSKVQPARRVRSIQSVLEKAREDHELQSE
jgi:hypothetical protein